MSPVLRLRILVRRFRRPACATWPCRSCDRVGRGGWRAREAWHRSRPWPIRLLHRAVGWLP